MKNQFGLFIFIFLLFSIHCQAQWIPQNGHTEAHFRSICAVNKKVVWIGGTKGTFVKTTDGGKSWQSNTVLDAEKLDFRDVYAFDDKKAFLMSAGEAEKGNAKIYKTTDGGATWKIVYQTSLAGVFFDGIEFWDKQNGIAFSDPINGKFFIITTQDGGETWSQIPAENLPAVHTGEAAFAASGTTLAVYGKSNVWIGTGGEGGGRVFSSVDKGKTWQVNDSKLNSGKSSGIFGLRFWNEKNGIAVGGDYINVKDSTANVSLTTDGGKTWSSSIYTDPVGLKEAVGIYKNKILVSVGPSGTCYSLDFGKKWNKIDNSEFHSISIAGDGIWAVGAKGKIAKLNIEILGK